MTIYSSLIMKILQISDTHNRHQLLTDMPAADVLVHCGDFTDMGTEEKVLDFLNWSISLPYPHNKTHYRLNLERIFRPLKFVKGGTRF